MKMEDLILGLNENENKILLVLKGPRGYRMDDDPTHTKEDWEDVWTQDVSRAHVFNETEMRKFMKGFMYNDIWREIRSIPVQFVDGVPQLISSERRRLFQS